MKIMTVVGDMAFSEKNYSIMSEINRETSLNAREASICYLNASSKVVPTNFATFNPSEIGTFKNGMLIATCLDSLISVQKSAMNNIKVLYLWDLSLIQNNFMYSHVYDTLKEFKIVIRSEEYKKIIDRLFDTNCFVGDFKLEELWNLQ